MTAMCFDASPKPALKTVYNGVARLPCARGQEISLRSRRQKLQSLKVWRRSLQPPEASGGLGTDPLQSFARRCCSNKK